MIDGFFFLVSCVAIGLLATWIMQNDRAAPSERTSGFFAMSGDTSDDSDELAKRAPGRRRRLPRKS